MNGACLDNGIVSDCLNRGAVWGSEGWIGGICGGSFGTVEKCYNEGEIKCIETGNMDETADSKDPEGGNIGGICGATGTNCNVIIRNCYNKGTVIQEVSGTTGVGGIVGWISVTNATGSINNNYNIGKIEIRANDVRKVGGIIGRRMDTDKYERKNNYYIEGTTRTEDNQEGESRTKEQMKTQQFVDELNEGLEEAVWMIENHKNGGYPILKDF